MMWWKRDDALWRKEPEPRARARALKSATNTTSCHTEQKAK